MLNPYFIKSRCRKKLKENSKNYKNMMLFDKSTRMIYHSNHTTFNILACLVKITHHFFSTFPFSKP